MKFKLTGILLLTFLSCTYVSEEDLMGDYQEPGELSYLQHVKPIIDNNCVVCHANPPVNGAPMSLLTYEQLIEAVENRDLLNRIQRQAGEEGAMPFGGPRLPQSLIDVMLEWEQQGMQE